MSGFDLSPLRAHFPILGTELAGRPLIYLDNAATMQVPDVVMDAMCAVMRTANANVHRGAHALSRKATEGYEAAREAVATFLGCDAGELLFTSGTTDGLNRMAAMLAPRLGSGSRIVVTALEHHANLLPWRHVAAAAGAEVAVAPVREDGSLNLDALFDLIDSRTKVVAATQLSNVSGVELPASAIAEAAHRVGAVCVADGAQGAAHAEVIGAKTGCDAYAFSGHKLGAPTGIGALYVNRDLLDGLEPATFGGGAVVAVGAEDVTYREGVARFEPGTPNYQGAAGLAAALGFWDKYGRREALAHEASLLRRFEQAVRDVPGVHVVAADSVHEGAVSLWFDEGTSYDVFRLLDAQGIAVRSGHHCAQPYLDAMGMGSKGTLRVSAAPYNTPEEMDACVQALGMAVDLMGR